ncbi:MAG: hypothetical protein ABL995_10955 [Bryobacteraceae bacterium]
MKNFPVVIAALGLSLAAPAFAQTDIIGEWGNRFHEDLWERRSGLQIGDFTGFSMTEAGRRMGQTWHPSWFSLKENQCRPHTSIYGLRGPADLRITKEADPATGRTMKYMVSLNFNTFQEVWMDGRPHPPDYAPHTWEGFTTGEWQGNMLKTVTTHIKAGYMQRNGAPHSDQAVTTQYWVRHGETLLLMSMVEDPMYYEEPIIKTTNWEAQDVNIGAWACGPAQLADETPGQTTGAVPHFLPGKNNQILEFTSQRHVPMDAASGTRESTYPEYLLKMEATQAAAKGAAPKRAAAAQTGFFGKWNLSIAKSTFTNDLTNFSLSGADGSAPQWRTMVIDKAGDAVKHTIDTQLVTNATNFIRTEYTAKLDGKEYPVDLSSTMDFVALKQINPTTIERVSKDRGKVVETATFKVSADGRELTMTSDGTGQGVKYHNVQVFERVEE